MAGARPPPFVLAFISICYTLVLCIHAVPACASSFAFNFSTISTSPCGTDLVCWGNASFANHMTEVTRNDISTGSGNSLGWVWHPSQVPLWDSATGELASFNFNTTFSFMITPDSSVYNKDGSPNSGDGMAFFLAPYPTNDFISSVDGGGNLGLFNATGYGEVVAVEFDTYQNQWDNTAQHVGIDVDSIKSVAAADTTTSALTGGKNNLTSGMMMTATISYDNRTKLLAVDLDIAGSRYNVSYPVDLRSFLPEKVAVGFSAATGKSSELHRISSWSFDSTLEEKVVPVPAPAPSQKFSPAPSQKISNPSDSSDPPVKQGPSTKLLLKVLLPILAVSVCAAVGVLVWLWQKRRRNAQQHKALNNSDSDEQHRAEEADFDRGVAGPRRYHYRELVAATGNFNDANKLGSGGFGSVYQGSLRCDGGDRQLAVKKFSSEKSSQGRKEFEAEVKIISRLRHRNLVQLLGWGDSAKGLLLVYELVPEGSLDKHIHNNPRLLTWPERYDEHALGSSFQVLLDCVLNFYHFGNSRIKARILHKLNCINLFASITNRYKIIMGIGSALRYLHLEWDQCIVHGDIKPSNIMLDSSYNTKLGDFGLARLVDHGTGLLTTANVAGTAGYIDPDFVNTHRPSTESDVYSFGIVLLEIVSGREPIVQAPPFVLLKWVWSLHSQGAILDAADARLRGQADADERQMERALVVGLWCAHLDPAERPSIAQAIQTLQSEDAKLPVLSPNMYKLAALPSVFSESGVSGSSFSSGVRSSATTGTTHSSESFPN
ncbi:hypothetical protein EJB05_42674, partial [Eragrostis curvula]